MEFYKNKTFKWVGLTVLSFLFLYLLAGFWTTLFIFTMVGLHEYGHLLAAKYVGVKTGGFCFLPIGGIALIKENPPEQWKKYYIAYGGPLIGLALVAIGILAFLIGKYNFFELSPVVNYQIILFSSNAIYLWAAINIFNLLPIYPFDGGRLIVALFKPKKKSKVFNYFLLVSSWTLLTLLFLYTKNYFVLIIALLGIYSEIMIAVYRKKGVIVKGGLLIGKLEDGYRANPPFSLKGKILGFLTYITLTALFVASIVAIFIL